MKKIPPALILDDDSAFGLSIKHLMRNKLHFQIAKTTEEALLLCEKQKFELIVLDLFIETENAGFEAFPKIKALQPDSSILFSSGTTDYKRVRQALLLGAHDFISKDFAPEQLEFALDKVMERRDLEMRSLQRGFEIQSQSQKRHSFLGKSQAVINLQKKIEKLKNSEAHVLITGETGTGKEVVARQLRGTDAQGNPLPFVAVDSSVIQSSTAESLLFGHEKGAFTGAEKSTRGYFEEANGGTIYFDEIANMPLEIQAKLLRVIQEQEVCRLGSTKVIPLQFRVIAATNRDLEEMSSKGEFKYDLFQRLNVIPLTVPPLKERKEDIPLLVDFFCRRTKSGEKIEFSNSALQALLTYDWPGNIRELSNVVSYVVSMSESNLVTPNDLPDDFLRRVAKAKARERAGAAEPTPTPTHDAPLTYRLAMETFERNFFREKTNQHQGNMTALAASLEIDRTTLYAKLEKLQIPLPARSKHPALT